MAWIALASAFAPMSNTDTFAAGPARIAIGLTVQPADRVPVIWTRTGIQSRQTDTDARSALEVALDARAQWADLTTDLFVVAVVVDPAAGRRTALAGWTAVGIGLVTELAEHVTREWLAARPTGPFVGDLDARAARLAGVAIGHAVDATDRVVDVGAVATRAVPLGAGLDCCVGVLTALLEFAAVLEASSEQSLAVGDAAILAIEHRAALGNQTGLVDVASPLTALDPRNAGLATFLADLAPPPATVEAAITIGPADVGAVLEEVGRAVPREARSGGEGEGEESGEKAKKAKTAGSHR